MLKSAFFLFLSCFTLVASAQNISGNKPIVRVIEGSLQGTIEKSGVHSFKGVPYAEPPIGDLRWKEPQPRKKWTGIRKADHFGPQAMQEYIYSDMQFRSEGKSEDCLYLNIWTPAKTASAKLPVLIYIYGGGFLAGDGSEYRYDGESMANKGIVSVTLNYRLGVFGLLAHPELTKESSHSASGNYSLLDQHAAIAWVKKNIASFGGDPNKITIAGESAGSMSVSGQMASPLSKGLFTGAIGESGSLLGNLSPVPLADAEQIGVKFATKLKTTSLSDLRKIPADSLLKWSVGTRFPITIDGYFLPKSPQIIFEKREQMDIPLLAGWNSAEVDYHSLLGNAKATLENYRNTIKRLYGSRADEVLKLYSAVNDEDVKRVATDLASDRFISYATWKFVELHSKTGTKPVFRYLFTKLRPQLNGATEPSEKRYGANHASEIEYALGNLHYNKSYNWTADDYKTSEMMETYFANFIKSGNPNGKGLSDWPNLNISAPEVMILNENPQQEPAKNKQRYLLLDTFFNKLHDF